MRVRLNNKTDAGGHRQRQAERDEARHRQPDAEQQDVIEIGRQDQASRHTDTPIQRHAAKKEERQSKRGDSADDPVAMRQARGENATIAIGDGGRNADTDNPADRRRKPVLLEFPRKKRGDAAKRTEGEIQRARCPVKNNQADAG